MLAAVRGEPTILLDLLIFSFLFNFPFTAGYMEQAHKRRIMQDIQASNVNVREVGVLSNKRLKGIQCMIEYIRENTHFLSHET